MPEAVNTSHLRTAHEVAPADEARETMVKVDDVSMVFNMASETMNNLKEYAIAAARRELHFKEFRALDHVSFEVKRGDVFGILGTNGSGKSTVLKIIAGVLEPSEGACTVNGAIAPLIELGAGFDMELTARENVYLNGALLGYSKSFIDEHFADIIEFAEIEKFLDMPLKNYSSGMVARIAFAIATIIVPDILIVDEVLSVGDFMFQQKCERRIQELINEHNVTVLIVSHSNEQIERLCNKAIWIEKGHERMIGSAHEVCQAYRILGGRVGSAEAEQRVADIIFHNPPRSTQALFSSITSDNVAGYSVKLAEPLLKNGASTAVIAPADFGAACYSASILASSLQCPLLTTPTDHLSDLTLQAMKNSPLAQIYCIGDEAIISSDVTGELSRELPEVKIQRITGTTASEISLGIFAELAKLKLPIGNTAAISYPECHGDLATLNPYFCEASVPVFFNKQANNIDSEIIEIIEKTFSRLIVVGGDGQFDENCLQPFKTAGLAIEVICGTDPYNANRSINNWLRKQRAGVPETAAIDYVQNIVIASCWNPSASFALAQYAKALHATVLLDDPGDLNSVALVIDFLESNKSSVQNISFLGNENIFREEDKTLINKALLLAREEH